MVTISSEPEIPNGIKFGNKETFIKTLDIVRYSNIGIPTDPIYQFYNSDPIYYDQIKSLTFQLNYKKNEYYIIGHFMISIFL